MEMTSCASFTVDLPEPSMKHEPFLGLHQFLVSSIKSRFNSWQVTLAPFPMLQPDII